MPEPRRFNVNVIALIAATGGFLFGYDLSIASGALIFLKEQFDLDAAGEGLAMSSAILGSIAGPVVGMWLADRVGRRATLWIAAVCFDLPPLNSTTSRERIWEWSKPREATNATRKEGTG